MNCFLFIILNTAVFMPVEDITQGMKGYGLTVFQGTKIDTFNVEVVDVMKGNIPQGDVILVKVFSEHTDKTGIISGMSGSPIYIRDTTSSGKLIGALAYSYAIFPVEHYAGVTPIAEMLTPLKNYGKPVKGFSELKIPLNLSGCYDKDILDEITKQFPVFNVVKMQAGARRQNDSIIPSPGSSLTIPLVTGDVDWSAVGTCTYRDGNKIWGFGHSLTGLGDVELPFSTGYIYSSIPSAYSSYKLGGSTKIVGTIQSDHLSGIAGEIGVVPNMLELNLTICKKEKSQTNKFNYQIIKEKTLLPSLLMAVTSTSIAKTVKTGGDITVENSVNVSGAHNFKFANLFTGQEREVMRDIYNVFSYIYNNPFKQMDIDNIEMELTFSDTVVFANIEDLLIDKTKVKTGDEIVLLIILSTYKAGTIKEYIQFKIPNWVKSGNLTVSVSSGNLISKKDLSNVKTLNEFVSWLTDAPRNNEFVVQLWQDGARAGILGETFEALPPSLASLFKETKKETRIMEKRIATRWVVSGENRVKLEVE